MAAADQIKSLIKSFGDGNEARFFATAMQIAASEAKKGHRTFSKELKSLIDKAKSKRGQSQLTKGRVVQMSPLRQELKGLLDVIEPKIKLNDMVLSPSVETALDRVVLEQKKFDLLKRAGLSPRRKLLLKGAPGCGKTMTAHALAGELGLSLFVVRLDGLISKYMGETISKLRMIFEAMESFRAVYLFDEFDSIGTLRTHTGDVGEIRRVLNSFLVNIEGDISNSLIIASTNLPETLDKALFRRFDDLIDYPGPDEEQIALLLEKHLHGFGRKGEQKLSQLAKAGKGLSHAEIVRACEEAIKEMIITEQTELSEATILQFLRSRR